jgi:hypothetical protein
MYRNDGMTPKIHLPLEIQNQTTAHIRECGSNGEEGFLAWSGVNRDDQIFIRSAVIPSEGAFRHHLGIGFSDRAIEHIADVIQSKGEKLIAQVHSHPFEAFHSETDDQFPLIHRKGFLSIVIPLFGKYGFEHFDTFRVYEYVQDNRWTELNWKTMRRRFRIEGTRKWIKWK